MGGYFGTVRQGRSESFNQGKAASASFASLVLLVPLWSREESARGQLRTLITHATHFECVAPSVTPLLAFVTGMGHNSSRQPFFSATSHRFRFFVLGPPRLPTHTHTTQPPPNH